MIRQVLDVLTEFGSDFTKNFLWIAFLVLVGSVVALTARSLVERSRGWARHGIFAIIAGVSAGVFKTLVGVALVAGLCLHLIGQSREFQHTHGRVSEANYQAVQGIWGRPHVQKELRVILKAEEEVKQTIELPDGSPARTITRKEWRQLPTNAITAADVNVTIKMDYRRKGSAYYTTFRDEAEFNYTVENPHPKPVSAEFTFPLSEDQGLFDDLRVAANGADMSRSMYCEYGNIHWKLGIPAGEKAVVTIAYRSRGMEYFYYQMPDLREIRNFRMQLLLEGVRPSEVNYPERCMTPTEQIVERPEGTLLEWKLDRAVTTRGMGVSLPGKRQPGYYVARLLKESPWGLVLLLTMVLVTRFATHRDVQPVPLALLAVAYHLFYTFMSYLSDYRPGFAGGFAISFLALGLLVTAFQLLWEGKGFVSWATLSFFAVFTVIYPLINTSREHAGLLLNILYVLLLAYAVCVGIAFRSRRPAEETPPVPA